MTLVMGIRVLLHGLLAQWPAYVSFFGSFLYIAVKSRHPRGRTTPASHVCARRRVSQWQPRRRTDRSRPLRGHSSTHDGRVARVLHASASAVTHRRGLRELGNV